MLLLISTNLRWIFFIKNICVYLYQNQEIMKNIYILPTDKPSVLYKRNDLKTYHLGDFDICNPVLRWIDISKNF